MRRPRSRLRPLFLASMAAALAACMAGGSDGHDDLGDDNRGGRAGGGGGADRGQDDTAGAGTPIAGHAGSFARGAGAEGGDEPSVGGAGGAMEAPAQGQEGGTPASGGTGGTSHTGMLPASDIPCTERVYCNDFEEASAGSRPQGAEVDAGNSVTISSDRPHAGKNALKVVVKPASGRTTARLRVALGDKLKDPKKVSYMRMMLYMAELPDGSVPGHWDVFAMQGQSSRGLATLGYGGTQNSKYNLTRWLYLAGGVDCAKQALPGIEPGRWNCIEVKVDENEAEPYSVSFDGVKQPGLTFDTEPEQDVCVADAYRGTWHVPRVETFFWGMTHWKTLSNTVTFYIDDIVVDQRPIGCPTQEKP